MESEYGNFEKYNRQFNIPYGTLDCGVILDWCWEQFGGDGYDNAWDYEIYLDDGAFYAFYFVNECDYNWFVLRWSS